MKTIVVNNKTKAAPKRAENVYLIFALVFTGLGIVAPLLGMVFAVVHSILVNDVVLNRASTILFVTAIPLLLVGSHFMDIKRERRKMRRQKQFQQRNAD